MTGSDVPTEISKWYSNEAGYLENLAKFFIVRYFGFIGIDTLRLFRLDLPLILGRRESSLPRLYFIDNVWINDR